MKNTFYITKSIVIVIAIVIVTALFPSCDIVEEPYLVQVGGNDTTPTVENVRKVLLEDYTGQKCPNCPEAAEVANSLIQTYGEQVVVIAVHSGNFAVPDATFTADFRTPEGTELNDFFGIYQFGYPMGMVNRTDYNGFPVVIKDDWETAVGEQLELDPLAAIKITTSYNAGTRKLDCTLETEFLVDLDGTYSICAYIIESGIVSPQQTETGVVQDYVHNHMLRGSMNGTWGDAVGTDGLAIGGTKVTNNCTLTLPSEWNAENCAIVAFVYNDETQDVIQAEEEGL